MPWDILNLALRPFRLAVRPKVGLVLKGSVDEVREAARRIKLVRINGVEIIGLDPPNNPSCAFLTDMRTLRFARLFARRLTDLESLQSLKELRRLAIEHTAKGQSIPIDFRSLPALESAALEWFQGAESIFGASNLRSADLAYYPAASSSSFVKLRHLERLRLAACALTEIEALGQIPSLTWLAPLRLDKLENFSGLSAHPALRFLWIEGCPKLRSLEWLAGMEALETLRILDCGEISGIGVVRRLPCLRHIHVHGSVKVVAQDMSFLRDLPNLESVAIKGLPSRKAEYWKGRNRAYSLLRSDLTGCANA